MRNYFKIYSNRFVVSLLCCCAFFFLQSCKKELSLSPDSYSTNDLTAFLANRIAIETVKKAKDLQTVSDNLVLTNIVHAKNIYGDKVFIASLKDYLIKDKAGFSNITYKMLFKLNAEGIFDASIYTIRTNMGLEYVDRNIANIINNETSDFNGEIIENTIRTTFKAGYKISNGKLTEVTKLEARSTPKESIQNSFSGTSNDADDDCSYYYIVTTYVYPNGQTTQTWDYAFSICGACNTGGQTVSTIVPDCDGTSNGSGGIGEASATSEGVLEETEITGESSTTREKIFRWICVQSNNGLWYVRSIEKGTFTKVSHPNPDLRWNYVTLDHVGQSIIGTFYNNALSLDLLYAAATDIGLYNAKMSLGVKVNTTATMTLPNGLSHTTTKVDEYFPYKTCNVNE